MLFQEENYQRFMHVWKRLSYWPLGFQKRYFQGFKHAWVLFLYWPYVSRKRLSGFLECMGMIFVLAMCFQKKIVGFFRMYEHDCHIGHVFPEKVVAFMGMVGI